MKLKRRLLRFAWHGATAMSLVLCMATLALWVRSYWMFDGLSFGSGTLQPYARSDYLALSARGEIACWRSEIQISGLANIQGVPLGWARHSRAIAGDDDVMKEARTRGVALLGFGFLHDDSTLSAPSDFIEDFALVAPHAAVASPFALLPVLWIWRRRQQRTEVGRCRSCGYDLRATPQEGGALLERCPECGAGAASIA